MRLALPVSNPGLLEKLINKKIKKYLVTQNVTMVMLTLKNTILTGLMQ